MALDAAAAVPGQLRSNGRASRMSISLVPVSSGLPPRATRSMSRGREGPALRLRLDTLAYYNDDCHH